MRTYGRVEGAWVEVDDTAQCWLTTLAQALKLNTGESPFFANYGIPQYQTIVTQVYPDYYVALMQQMFAPNFASLTVSRVQASVPPVYNINVMLPDGSAQLIEVAT